MDKDILTVISRETSGFSKGQRAIAKYILEYYDKAAFMTAGKLGHAVGVSESTVVRFASELGYEGYPEMRKALQEMIRNRLTSVQRIEVAKEMLDDSNVVRTVLSSDIDKLHATMDGVSQEDFDLAVEMILAAHNIYIVGMRSSTCLANFLNFYLNLLMDNVRTIQDTAISEIYEQIIHIGEGDLFIGVSFPRYSSRTANAMKFAKRRGAKALGITDGEASPFIGVADLNLFAKSDMVSFVDSLVAPLSLINALIVAIGVRSRENLPDIFQKLETIWSEYSVFQTDEH
ncbi:MAG: MurR/RpiR family transcriptional regulator [Clostridiales bacterium]|nr:MurR/RpiR family transcriptional regulator [Clostridiales bacterium]